jgi:hypothetical protein
VGPDERQWSAPQQSSRAGGLVGVADTLHEDDAGEDSIKAESSLEKALQRQLPL